MRDRTEGVEDKAQVFWKGPTPESRGPSLLRDPEPVTSLPLILDFIPCKEGSQPLGHRPGTRGRTPSGPKRVLFGQHWILKI